MVFLSRELCNKVHCVYKQQQLIGGESKRPCAKILSLNVIVCVFSGATYLLEHAGVSPNELYGDVTPMHLAAGLSVKAVCLLLQYAGDPNIWSVDNVMENLYFAVKCNLSFFKNNKLW